jgi:CMP-N-acetylneuraminic acid synthetase
MNFPVPIQQALKIKNNTLSYLTPNFSKIGTQKFKKSFYDAGQFYLGTRYSWTNNSKIIKGIILPKYSSIDIDDNEDWLFSKSLYKLFKNEKKL